MKLTYILLFCFVTMAFAFDDDEVENTVVERSKVNKKKLRGGYTFETEDIGGGRYKCRCFLNQKPVWAGMCGVTDKSFNYKNCWE